MKHHIDGLLEIKMGAPEVVEGPRIEPLDRYIDEEMPLLRSRLEALPNMEPKGWDGLNRLFVDLIMGNGTGRAVLPSTLGCSPRSL